MVPNYLLGLVVFTMLLAPNVKHILPRAIWLQNKNRMTETALTQWRKESSLIMTMSQITMMQKLPIFKVKLTENLS